MSTQSMVSAKSASTKNPKNVYHIGGLQVEFPYQPYGSQFAFMGRVISTLNRAQREGHCHALLESPTGTGKSLSLLCSSLAWQQNYKLNKQNTNPSHLKPAPEATTDPLAYGGGFVPDEVSPTSENMELPESEANNKKQKKKAAPTIYYASRTHSQISQVIRELRKTAYRVPMAVLASRKHYCTNKHILAKENIDEECKLLLKDQATGCPEFKSAHKVKGHPSLQRGGCNEVHDIEDLVKVGHAVKGCSYYAARNMSDDAQLVFCPYSYIINPVIRGAMDVDIQGAIVILDEAHNIEDITRDAGSVDIGEDVLDKLKMELQQLCPDNPMIYQPLYEMTQGLTSWIERRKNNLEKRDFQHYVTCWTGEKALRELQEANISLQCFPILLECATKAIRIASDLESEDPHLSGMSVITLEGLFSALTYFFSRNGSHMLDYQLALQRVVKKDAGAFGNWTHTLSLWCLNPAVVFSDIANLSLSVILTSGTLSPMNSFSSELGAQFETSLEAPHVIDVDSQVWPAVVCTGPGNYPLNASYKTADGYAFQDEVGRSLEEIFKIVPGGCLVFFPSYKLMEKLCTRWSETGQWSQLNAEKLLFVEPRGGSQDDFELVLKGYFDTIRLGNRPTLGRKKRIKKIGFNSVHAVDTPKHSKKGGAALLGVCRGKVSEGIDFSDDNARVVIIVGIPFPNINDIKVALKKKYNDTYKSSKNLLSGNEWYCNQAFRALNQAAGRSIRHRLDYGAVILLDERFREQRNRAFISKWLRKTLRVYESFGLSLEGLKSFFEGAKEQFGTNATQNSGSIQDGVETKDQNNGFKRKPNQKQIKSDNSGEKEIAMIKDDGSFPKLRSPDHVESQPSMQKNTEPYNYKEYIDLEVCNQPEPSFTGVVAVTHEETSLVKESPCVDGSSDSTSPGYCSKDDYSSSTIIEASSELCDQLSSVPVFLTTGSKASSTAQSSALVTPEKNITANNCRILEVESSLNKSVNSHTQKRRKSMDTPVISLIDEESCIAPSASTPTRQTLSLVNAKEATNGNELGSNKKWKSTLPQLHTSNLDSSCLLTAPLMEKLQISCSLCKNPLGRPENHLYIACSLTSSLKVHLRSLLQQRLKAYANDTSSVPVVITGTSFIDQRLYNSINGSSPEQGIWCEEDGCVFRSIFCPFCSNPDNLLGVQILATNSSNSQLLDKVLFYFDFVEVKDPEESRNEASNKVDLSLVSGSGMDEFVVPNSFDKFSYQPQLEKSRVSIKTRKSKQRLPTRGLTSNAESQSRS